MHAYIFWNDLTKEAQDRIREDFKPYIDIDRSWTDFWTELPMAVVEIDPDSELGVVE